MGLALVGVGVGGSEVGVAVGGSDVGVAVGRASAGVGAMGSSPCTAVLVRRGAAVAEGSTPGVSRPAVGAAPRVGSAEGRTVGPGSDAAAVSRGLPPRAFPSEPPQAASRMDSAKISARAP